MKNLLYSGTILLLIVLLTNCNKDNENLLPTESNDTAFYFVDVDFTVEEWVENAHLTLRAWYGKELGFSYSDFGTDIYTYGSDNRTGSFYVNNYDVATPLVSNNESLRKELGRGILYFKKAIEKASESSAEYSTEIAKARFLKALYNWLVVETWGDEDVDSVYSEIFNDLNHAATNLPASQSSNTLLTSHHRLSFLLKLIP